MTKNTLLIALLLFIASTTFAQEKNPIDLGVEFQVYPTGILPGVKASFGIGPQSSFHVRAGLNIFDHRDLGVQEMEEGDGFGFTLGYQYYFGENHTKWFLGIRSDFWWNTVDWETQGQTGITDIFVIQPTAIGGYAIELANGNLILEPALGFGFEVNVRTEGEETGQGAIGLAGISLAYRIQ